MSEIYGRNPVIEALKSGTEINRITIAKGARHQATREIYELARERQIPVAQVERKKLDQLFPGKTTRACTPLWQRPPTWSGRRSSKAPAPKAKRRSCSCSMSSKIPTISAPYCVTPTPLACTV